MNLRDLRRQLGDTQSEFAARYKIPFRTVQNWETGLRTPPEYFSELLEKQILTDLINRKTAALPKYDPRKPNLPKRRDFVGALSWLRAVRGCLGHSVIFALDEALMCEGSFGGHSDEYVVWVYGDDTVSRYNGVVVLGKQVSPYSVKEKGGLRYTDLSRTISDAFANEELLDMQGITEAVSRYYYRSGNSFEGISVAPQYQERFDKLAREAIDYYSD